MQEWMPLIVFSGTIDKLMAASILATGGVAMGLRSGSVSDHLRAGGIPQGQPQKTMHGSVRILKSMARS